MRILLGSKNPHKLAAARLACKRLHIRAQVRGFACPLFVNAQPMGLAEITAGALARMWNIHGSFSRDTDVVVGIENGIVHVKCEREFCNDHEYYLDLAVVVVMKPNGNLIITTSSAVQVPPAFVFDAERRGFNKWTVGRLIAQRAKRASPSPPGDPTDPHSIMTGGKVSRTMLLTDALVTAFRQL